MGLGRFERKLQIIYQSISEWDREDLEQAVRNQFSSRFVVREDGEGQLGVYVSAEQAKTDRWLAEYFFLSQDGISFRSPLKLPHNEVSEELFDKMKSQEWIQEGDVLINESRHGILRTPYVPMGTLLYKPGFSSRPGEFETKTGDIIHLEVRPVPRREFGQYGVLKTVLDSYEWNGALTTLFAHCGAPLDKVT